VDKLLPLRIGLRRTVGRETTPTRDDEDEDEDVVVVVVVTAVVVDRIAIVAITVRRSFFDVPRSSIVAPH
jgi:hypothetical protein